MKKSSEDLNICPPQICTNSSQMRNDSAFNVSGEGIFIYLDKEYLLLLEEIWNSNTCQKLEEDARLSHACSTQANVPNFITEHHRHETSSQHKASVTNEVRLVRYFCSNIVFTLSRKILTDIEIKILEKVLDFAPPTQNEINKPEL